MVSDNIKKMRKLLNLTQQAFADRIGIKQNSVALIESGKRNVSNPVLVTISREFGVRLEWLKTGEGEMFKPRDDSPIAQLAADYGLNENDVAAIESFLELSPEHRRGVIEWGKNLMAKLASQMQIEVSLVDEENVARNSNALTEDDVVATIGQEYKDRAAAEKRGTSTLLAFTGTSGMRKKFGNSP